MGFSFKEIIRYRRNQLTHSRPPSYTARRHEFAQSYVVSRACARMRRDALEIVDCGIEPG
jgi:hypothetical protein